MHSMRIFNKYIVISPTNEGLNLNMLKSLEPELLMSIVGNGNKKNSNMVDTLIIDNSSKVAAYGSKIRYKTIDEFLLNEEEDYTYKYIFIYNIDSTVSIAPRSFMAPIHNCIDDDSLIFMKLSNGAAMDIATIIMSTITNSFSNPAKMHSMRIFNKYIVISPTNEGLNLNMLKSLEPELLMSIVRNGNKKIDQGPFVSDSLDVPNDDCRDLEKNVDELIYRFYKKINY
jgi:hypothetical protein